MRAYFSANGIKFWSPWSSAGSGRANSAPATTVLPSVAAYDVGVTVIGTRQLSSNFSDGDGDALTYSVRSQYPGIISASISGNRVHAYIINPGITTMITYKAVDAYGGSATNTWTLTGTRDVVRSVEENSAAGTLVGAPVTGTPYDDGNDQTDDTLTYTLEGEAATAFDIDAATGQISVKQGATLDYDTKSSYTGLVRYIVHGWSARVDLTINVTEAGQPGTPMLTRTEFSEPTAPALDVSWTAPTDVDVAWYQARYRKQGETSWTSYTGLLQRRDTSLRLSNLEPGATYEVQVRARANGDEGDIAPWSDTGSGTANRPPATTAYTSTATYDVGLTVVSASPLSDWFTDADGDTLTYSVSSQYPGIISASMSGDNIEAFIINPGVATVITYKATDPYGGSGANTWTFTGNRDVVRSVEENSAAGTLVGAPVTGTPYDDGNDETDDTLSYAMNIGEVGAAFVIDSTTGQISVRQGATLDYDTKSSYTGQITYVVQGQVAKVDVTINVTKAGKPGTPVLTRWKPTTDPCDVVCPALEVTWTAPTGFTPTGYEVQYRKKVAEGETQEDWARFSQQPATAPKWALSPALEPGETYEFRVRAGNADGPGPWSDIGEGRANRPPTASSVFFGGGSIPVGTILTWDEEDHLSDGPFFEDADGDELTYTASSEHPALLGVDLSGPAGAAVLKATLLNQGASKVNYTASDPYGGQVTRTVTITITAKTSREIAENSPGGTNVGDPVTGTPYDDGDPNTDDSLTYTLTGNAADSNLFVINSSTGQISVKSGATIDYETDDTYREIEYWPPNSQTVHNKFYRGKVNYTVNGHAAAIEVLILVRQVVPGKLGTPTVTRTEFSAQSDPALDVTWTAPTDVVFTGYEAQYRKKVAEGEQANSWTAYSGTLSNTDTTLNLPDLDAGATYEVQVRVVMGTEGEGPWSDTGEGTANRPPNRTSLNFLGGSLGMGGSFKWQEGPPWGEGPFFADADGDTLTYSGSAEHPARLRVSVSGTPGTNAVLTAKLLNQGKSKVNYTASDGYGGQVTHSANITITASTVRTIAENSAGGTAVGAPVTGTPYDDGDDSTDDALTYSLTGKANASGLFVIDSATGQISVKSGATIDYETDDTHREIEYWPPNSQTVFSKFYRGKVEYTVDGLASAIDVLITITNVDNEDRPGKPALTRTEFSEPTDPALDVTWTAPGEADGTITGYKAQYRKKGDTSWTAYTGTLGATDTTFNLSGLDAGATYEAQVRAVTSENGDGSWSPTGEGRANRPPTATSVDFLGGTFPVGSESTWDETQLPGNGAYFTDADRDTLTYAASAQHPALLGVSLTGSAGSAVLTANLLNQGESKVNYTASDAYGGSVTRTATIGITAKVSRSIAENSPGGTAVGAPVTGTPYDDGDDQTDDSLTYSLTGKANDSELFVIDSATGQISVKQGATIDYETDDTHREIEYWPPNSGTVFAKFYRGKVNYTVNGNASPSRCSSESPTWLRASRPRPR